MAVYSFCEPACRNPAANRTAARVRGTRSANELQSGQIAEAGTDGKPGLLLVEPLLMGMEPSGTAAMFSPLETTMKPRSYLLRYGFAAAAVAAALGFRLLLQPLTGIRVPYAAFFVAVAISAILGGLGPGLFASLLGGLAASYYLLPPEGFAIEGPHNRAGMALYGLVSTALVLLTAMQRKARMRAETAAQLAEERRAQLEREVRLREEAEAAERLGRQRFETTLASIGDGVIATDLRSRITFINPVAAQLTGWPQAEAIGQPVEAVFEIVNEETDAKVENPVTRALREGRIVGLANHTLLRSRDGRLKPIDDSGAPIVDWSGKTCGAVLVFRDISKARARDAELRERNRMIDLAHDAIIVLDSERRIKSWNRGACEIYGWEEREVRGQIAHELLKTRNSGQIEEVDKTLRERGRWDGELVHTCKDGRVIITESRHVLLRDADGGITGVLEVNRDVTERKQAEAELRRVAAEAEVGRRTLEALMTYIPEGLTIVDAPDVRVRMISRYGLELVGRKPESLIGSVAEDHPSAWGIYHLDGRTLAQPGELPLTRAVALGEITTDEEWLIKRPDGKTVPVLCNAAPIRDSEGNITGGLIAWRDLSQRKELEEKLRETAKLESLGILAGGIAHDFNNLLTGVLGNASLLLEEAAPGTPAWSFAEGISKSAERAAKLTQQMLAYSGRGRFVVEPIELSEQIREMLPLVEASLPRNIELRVDLAQALPLVEVDLVQLQQVVMNLVVNSAEAIGPEGGCIEIATRARQIEEAGIRTRPATGEIGPGAYVVLEVSDNGCGIEETKLGRIFDPFFTTKFTGRGLGLAAVQGIVRGHKGAIEVLSTPGAGTTFRVLLPASSAAAKAQARSDQAGWAKA